MATSGLVGHAFVRDALDVELRQEIRYLHLFDAIKKRADETMDVRGMWFRRRCSTKSKKSPSRFWPKRPVAISALSRCPRRFVLDATAQTAYEPYLIYVIVPIHFSQYI
jgi:hypothetical protein